MDSLIRNREFARQLKLFDGLRWGTIVPTDLDMFVDFGDRLFVFAEAKRKGSPMPYGQELAFMRLVDACHKPPFRLSAGFVVEHQSDGDISFGLLLVRSCYFEKKWKRIEKEEKTLKNMIDQFLEKISIP